MTGIWSGGNEDIRVGCTKRMHASFLVLSQTLCNTHQMVSFFGLSNACAYICIANRRLWCDFLHMHDSTPSQACLLRARTRAQRCMYPIRAYLILYPYSKLSCSTKIDEASLSILFESHPITMSTRIQTLSHWLNLKAIYWARCLRRELGPSYHILLYVSYQYLDDTVTMLRLRQNHVICNRLGACIPRYLRMYFTPPYFMELLLCLMY